MDSALDPQMPQRSNEEREAERRTISAIGRYRSGRGIAREVELQNLSRTGCRFFERFGKLEPGKEISLRVGSLAPIIATVRWREKGYVGVSFDPPLHDAVWNHVTTQNPR
ncbi:PilZ domain-containing protein [Altererythrobacter sp. CAU 1778]